MIRKIDVEDILLILRDNPEQTIFDWKRNLNRGNNEDERSEHIKDIVAIANAITTESGFIFFGVDPNQTNPILGISNNFDDSKFQQLLKDKVQPAVRFLYYEIVINDNSVGVIEISADNIRPHIIIENYGKLRDGQILIRIGSSTRGIRLEDLMEYFYGQSSPYFEAVKRQLGIDVKALGHINELLRQLKQDEKDIDNDINRTLGF